MSAGPQNASGEVPATPTSGATAARGGVWNVTSAALSQVYLVVMSIAAARFLGASGLGRQSYIAFVEIALATALTGGLPTALARYVGEAVGRGDRRTLAGLLRWSWRLASVGALLGAAALVLIALSGSTPRAAWLFAAIVVVTQVLGRVPNAFLNGLQRWRDLSVIAVTVGLLATGGVIAVLAAGGGISEMFAVEAAAGLIALGWLARVARRFRPAGVQPRLDREQRRSVGRYALLATGGVILTLIVYRRSEFLFLDHYSSDAQIALYSIGFSAVAALVLLPQALIGVALPAVATLWGAGAHDRIRSGYGRATRLLLLVTFPLTAGAIALGPETLRLVYGQGFSSIGPVLLILLAPMPLLSVITLSNAVLAAIGRLTFALVTGVIAAAVNIGLDLALIPAHGATGAALANSGAQLAAGVPVMVYAHRLVRPTGTKLWPVARAAAASVLAGLVAWATLAAVGGVAGVCAGLVLGVLAFALLASVLRILVAEDARWLEQAGGVRLAPALKHLSRWWAPRQAV